jgi:uncharacterized protein with ParB-like and HNH nuclease domain/predicted transport protein
MQAKEANLLQFLNGTKQLVIPIYQRTYSWTSDQCWQLWNDIIRVANDSQAAAHFIGSIVYIQKGIYQTTAVPQLLVIDGQQRLTTITILLTALGRVIEESGLKTEINRRRVENYYLFNADEDGDLRYKLFLTQSDKDTLIRILDGEELPSPHSNRIRENYEFFLKQIRNYSKLDKLYQGISKLLIVDISLDREKDNPQLIFESLNSTGLDLSQADLIRNYVLMGLEPKEQAELYKKLWYPMEQSFGYDEYTARFDRFIRDYLTIKTGQIPKIGDVYNSFKVYSKKEAITITEVVEDIYRFSKLYIRLALLREEDSDIRLALTDITTLKVDVSYPFLLQVYEDYESKKISKVEFIEILRLVESYVFRRAICGIPPNSLNKTFATLYKDVKSDSYVESVKAAFLLKESHMRFPLDDEFWAEFGIKDVYNSPRRNYILRKLENFDRKEKVDVESYTIEHIMPQNSNLPSCWQAELGSNWKTVHSKYLHTVGNLTLTGYNPELSDRSFKEKRDMKGGFADSPIRLNHSLAKFSHWDESAINKRAEELADLAVKVWVSPNLPADILDKYRKNKPGQGDKIIRLENIENAHFLQGDLLELFNELRKRILNLDVSVKEEYKKQYIAYKTNTNFVDIVLQRNKLCLLLNMPFEKINDPKNICKDVSGLGRWGNGDVEVKISSKGELDYIMTLINQSYEMHLENEID